MLSFKGPDLTENRLSLADRLSRRDTEEQVRNEAKIDECEEEIKAEGAAMQEELPPLIDQ